MKTIIHLSAIALLWLTMYGNGYELNSIFVACIAYGCGQLIESLLEKEI